jgi:hypothetical protein
MKRKKFPLPLSRVLTAPAASSLMREPARGVLFLAECFLTPAPVCACRVRMLSLLGSTDSGAGLLVSASKPGACTPGEGGTAACSERVMTLKLSPAMLPREMGVEGGSTGGSLGFIVEARSGGVLGRVGLIALVLLHDYYATIGAADNKQGRRDLRHDGISFLCSASTQ